MPRSGSGPGSRAGTHPGTGSRADARRPTGRALSSHPRRSSAVAFAGRRQRLADAPLDRAAQLLAPIHQRHARPASPALVESSSRSSAAAAAAAVRIEPARSGCADAARTWNSASTAASSASSPACAPARIAGVVGKQPRHALKDRNRQLGLDVQSRRAPHGHPPAARGTERGTRAPPPARRAQAPRRGARTPSRRLASGRAPARPPRRPRRRRHPRGGWRASHSKQLLGRHPEPPGGQREQLVAQRARRTGANTGRSASTTRVLALGALQVPRVQLALDAEAHERHRALDALAHPGRALGSASRSAGSLPAGSGTTRSSSRRPAATSAARIIASWPALSASSASSTTGASRASSPTWSSVSDVPISPTALRSPA